MRSTRLSNNADRGRRLARHARAFPALLAAGLLGAALPAAALPVAGGAAGAPPFALSIEAAWGGFARPGSSTELRIELSAAQGGRARVRIDTGRIVIATAIALHPGTPARLVLPVPVSDRLGVDAILPGGRHLHRELALRLTENPLVALSPGASGPLPDDLAHADIDADGYPHHAEGYEAVDAIAIDGATLARLDSRQMKALLTYIERCGPTLAVALPASAAALLRANAGCNGRALTLLEGPTDLGSAAEALLAAAPPAPVQAASLRSLLAPSSGAWPLVVAGLAIYAVIALLLVLFEARTAVLALCALAAALILFMAGHLSTAAPRLSIWAESEPADHWGRYAALAEFPGTGRALRAIALPALLDGAQPCADRSDDAPPPLWRWDARTARFTRVTLHQRLFALPSICWRGAFPLARRATLTRRRNGEPSVTNLGEGAWPAGIAVLDDGAFALPALAPRASVALTPSHVSAVPAPAAELALLRAEGGGALLWPLDLPRLDLGQTSIRAYLLERVPAAVAQRRAPHDSEAP